MVAGYRRRWAACSGRDAVKRLMKVAALFLLFCAHRMLSFPHHSFCAAGCVWFGRAVDNALCCVIIACASFHLRIAASRRMNGARRANA